MSKKLFSVRVEIEELVLAEDEASAKQVFRDYFSDIANNPDDFGIDISRATSVPYHDDDDLVYSDSKEDFTLKQALEIDPYMNVRHMQKLVKNSEKIKSSENDDLAK